MSRLHPGQMQEEICDHVDQINVILAVFKSSLSDCVNKLSWHKSLLDQSELFFDQHVDRIHRVCSFIMCGLLLFMV